MDTNIVVPATYEGLPITAVADFAFWDQQNLKTIVLPNTVQSIGEEAFWNCVSLTRISLPDSVASIGARAFQSCIKLEKVKLGAGVRTIGVNAFGNCQSLTFLQASANNPAYSTINGSLYNKAQTSMVQYAGGRAAKTVTLPDSVTRIENYAFINRRICKPFALEQT